ncbi:MAG: hypothetical protein U5K69_27645 [Balneolaceae bacterium]|nr:hypothetical protein [Balneolaceae bacterium]
MFNRSTNRTISIIPRINGKKGLGTFAAGFSCFFVLLLLLLNIESLLAQDTQADTVGTESTTSESSDIPLALYRLQSVRL